MTGSWNWNWQLALSAKLQRQRASALKSQLPAPAGAEPPQPGGADHRRVVGRERDRRNEDREAVRAPRASASARSRLLADTPPAIPTLRAPSQRAASNVRSSSASTTTRWKLAQMSATSDGRQRGARGTGGRGFPAGRRAGALADEAQHRGLQAAEAEVDPARDVRRQQAVGGRLRARCDPRASTARPESRTRGRCPRARARSITGPPGYPRPSSFATLSYASPAASSRVRPIRR